MTRVFNDYARRTGLLKEKDKNLEGADIREGISAIISVRIPEEILQFEGQTKGKLGTSEARSVTRIGHCRKTTLFLRRKCRFKLITYSKSNSFSASKRSGTKSP